LSIDIADAPRFFTSIKVNSFLDSIFVLQNILIENLSQETPELLPQISENTKLYLCIAKNSESCEMFNGNCDLVRSDDHDVIIFDDKFIKNLRKFNNLYSLTMSTFYTNVNWTYLCDLGPKDLYLFNDKFYENDATVDILSTFAELNPDCLCILSLKMCKIDVRGIESLKCFTHLYILSFETMHGLTNELIAQISISIPKGYNCDWKIINNDYLDDETCLGIINERQFRVSLFDV